MQTNLSGTQSKVAFIEALIPQAVDALKPKFKFRFSDAFVELLVADVVKTVSAELTDRELGQKTLRLSRQMAETATRSMVSSWELDDICPPWPFPFPHGWRLDETVLNQTDGGFKPVGTAGQVELASVLTHLSGLTSSLEFNQSLKTLATSVVRGVSSQLTDDFERCGTRPRKPFPKPKGQLLETAV